MMTGWFGIVRHALIAGLPLLALSPAGGTAAAEADGPLDAFQALEERLVDLHEAYTEADREHAKDEGKTADESADPRLVVLKQMDELTDASATHVDGAAIAIGTFFWSWNLDLDLGRLYGRFERIVDRYADDAGLDDLLPEASGVALATKQVDEWAAGLARLSAATKRAETRVGAQMALGQLYLGANRLKEAKTSFRAAVKHAGVDKELVALAEGFIFEIEHLQVGMVAPDFSAKTLAGETVSLASLRGKTVLLNFWASW